MTTSYQRFYADSIRQNGMNIAIPIEHSIGVQQLLRINLTKRVSNLTLLEATPKTARGVPSAKFQKHPSAKVFTLTACVTGEAPELTHVEVRDRTITEADTDPDWQVWEGITVVRLVFYRRANGKNKRTASSASYVFRGAECLALESFESYREICSHWDSMTPGFSNVKHSEVIQTHLHNGLIYAVHYAPNGELHLSAHYRPVPLQDVPLAIGWRFGWPVLLERQNLPRLENDNGLQTDS